MGGWFWTAFRPSPRVSHRPWLAEDGIASSSEALTPSLWSRSSSYLCTHTSRQTRVSGLSVGPPSRPAPTPPAQVASIPRARSQAVKAAPRCGLGISGLASPALCPLASELEGLSSSFSHFPSLPVLNLPEPLPALGPYPATPGAKIPSQVPAEAAFAL